MPTILESKEGNKEHKRPTVTFSSWVKCQTKNNNNWFVCMSFSLGCCLEASLTGILQLDKVEIRLIRPIGGIFEFMHMVLPQWCNKIKFKGFFSFTIPKILTSFNERCLTHLLCNRNVAINLLAHLLNCMCKVVVKALLVLKKLKQLKTMCLSTVRCTAVQSLISSYLASKDPDFLVKF